MKKKIILLETILNNEEYTHRNINDGNKSAEDLIVVQNGHMLVKQSIYYILLKEAAPSSIS